MTPIASGRARRSVDGAVDPPLIATATRPGLGRGTEHLPERIRDGVRGERLAGHGGGLEQREAGERPRHPRRVRLDDPVAVDDEPRGAYASPRAESPITSRGIAPR